LVISIFILAGGIAHAAGPVFSLKDAVNAAEKNYPSVKTRLSYIRAASESIKEAKREFLPSLKLSEQLTYATANSLPGTYFSYGVSVSGSIAPQENDNPNFGQITALYSEWPVYTFGLDKAKEQYAVSGLKLQQASLDNEKFQLAYRTAEAYFDLIQAISLRKSQEKNLDRANTIRNVIRSSVASGLKPGVDSSTANAEVSRARMMLIDARHAEKLQRNYLQLLTGITDSTMQPDTAYLQQLPAAAQPVYNVDNNPVLAYYTGREALNTAREQVIRRSYLPKIELLGAVWGRGSGIEPEAPNRVDPSFQDGARLSRYNFAVGVGAFFNIADYPRMNAEANAIKYQGEGLQSETLEQKIALQNAEKNAEDAYLAAMQKAYESPVLMAAARTAYSQTLAMYNAGLANFSDLAQAFFSLNNAEAQYAISYNNVWKARLVNTVPAGDINLLLKQF
jgi:outer membrane protein TolC